MIWRLIWLAVGVALGGGAVSAYAATVPYKFSGMNVTRDGGVTYLRGTSPAEVTASAASVSNHVLSVNGSANWYQGTGALLQNGGVIFNAAVPIAATAASVAVTAIRLNPAGLVTSAVVSYLLTKGIDYANGQFAKVGTSIPALTTAYNCVGGVYTTDTQAACNQFHTINGWALPITPNGTLADGRLKCRVQVWSTDYYCSKTSVAASCPSGYTLSGSSCVPASVPAVESDWDAARVGYWPDPAILDLVKNGVPLPTDQPTFTPPYKDVTISDPYIDPVTGNRYKDVARVTPNPSAPDTATVQMTKQQVDAAGAPVVDPVTHAPVAPVEEKDPCKINPDASACKPLDDVSDSALLTGEISLSLSPVSGFGPDSGTCPSPQTLMTKRGVPVVWSWQMYCDFASGIRPLIVGFAWLAALMIVIGVARRGS